MPCFVCEFLLDLHLDYKIAVCIAGCVFVFGVTPWGHLGEGKEGFVLLIVIRPSHRRRLEALQHQAGFAGDDG